MRRGDYESLVARIDPGARLLDTTIVSGSIPSAGAPPGEATGGSVVRIDIGGSEIERLAVKTHGPRDLVRNPNIAADEFHLLERLHAAGLAVPRPILFDPADGADAHAVVVLEWIDGTPRFDPFDAAALAEYAHMLARVHRSSIDTRGIELPPPRGLPSPPSEPPDETIEETRSRRLLERHPPTAPNPSTLLHGDYWPGNVLWRNERVDAVIDWEDFGYGDPLADLASARLELCWAMGEAALREFTRAYLDHHPIGTRDLAFWDIAATLHFSHQLPSIATSGDDLERLRRATRQFLQAACDRLR